MLFNYHTHPVPEVSGEWTLKSGHLRLYWFPIPDYLTNWINYQQSLDGGPRACRDGFGGYFFNSTMRGNFVIIG